MHEDGYGESVSECVCVWCMYAYDNYRPMIRALSGPSYMYRGDGPIRRYKTLIGVHLTSHAAPQ